jgi:hypothetical protein
VFNAMAPARSATAKVRRRQGVEREARDTGTRIVAS